MNEISKLFFPPPGGDWDVFGQVPDRIISILSGDLLLRNVALYARVSTKDKGQDVENQLSPLREFCARQGYVIHDEYIDDESGAKGKRERAGFAQLFEEAGKRKFDTENHFLSSTTRRPRGQLQELHGTLSSSIRVIEPDTHIIE